MEAIFAVFIDADNVPAHIVQKLMNILKKRGRIRICKVFGDFSRAELAPWKQACLTFNIEAIMAWHKAGKNSSDLKICQSCAHMLYSHPTISNYVLVTGDGDFTTIIQDLKTHGKQVICMGLEKQCSTVLMNCCDEFISLQQFSSDKTNSAKSRAKLVQAIEQQFQNSDEDMLNCGALKEQLLRINPTFTEVNYNEPSFGQLLTKLGYTICRNKGGTPFCKKK